MAKKLTDEEKTHVEQVPEAHTVPELQAVLEEKGLNSKGSKDELIERIKTGDDGTYEPDTFHARFNPASPPKKALAPIKDTADTDTTASSVTAGLPAENVSTDTGTGGAGAGAGGTAGAAGTGNVGNAGTPGGGTTTTPGS